MKARPIVAFALALTAAGGELAAQTPYGRNPDAARSLVVEGARIYYERYGTGPSVVLLHGGLFGSIAELTPLIDDLRRDRTVIAIALRGHAPSEMGTAVLSHERIARDAAAIVMHEGSGPVDVIGFSSGAMAAYRLTILRPDLVRSVVAIGGPIAEAGYTDGGKAELQTYASPAEVEKLYPRLVRARRQEYRDPADWDRLVLAFDAIARTEPDIPDTDMRKIAQRMLIVAGDRDEYTRLDHFTLIYQLLRKGSLAIVPGCGHVVLMCRPELMKQLVRAFLDGTV
jgi:pimeloyl-ACP methyl ester carboxylesterase